MVIFFKMINSPINLYKKKHFVCGGVVFSVDTVHCIVQGCDTFEMYMLSYLFTQLEEFTVLSIINKII